MKNRNSIFMTALLGLACLALLPEAQAVSPAPDGCYPNFTTAEGCDALAFLNAGAGNTGLGWRSLYLAGDSNFNTGVGAGTLVLNTADSNTAVGAAALLLNTAGAQNVAVGTDALLFNGTGSNNTAVGAFALFGNTEGDSNTAVGTRALYSNTEGFFNTASGLNALASNTTGNSNTATGFQALGLNSVGNGNTATGFQALTNNTTGYGDVAVGFQALAANSTGFNNTAVGVTALVHNTTGGSNTAVGVGALYSNIEGDVNTAIGRDALLSNTTGTFNTAVGNQALLNATGSFNIGLRGGSNLTTGDFNIDIGSDGVAGESGTIRIGDGCCQSRAFMAGISGTAVSGSAVVVDANGQLGVAPSSAQFKDGIQPMGKASEAILALRPVSFRYKKEIDPQGISQFGLVAEEVEKVNPDLILRDREGKPHTVRYEQINAMLLNEFLKEHRKVEEQDRKIAAQQATIAQLRKDVQAVVAHAKDQDSNIQKVSAQVEVTKPGAASP